MQLKSLKVFCDIVGHRSFSRAAAENGLSQSAASQTVHHLEQELGVKLIDRSKRPFVLTPEGELYCEGCRELVARYYTLEDDVRKRHQELAGRVRVISIHSVGLHHMQRCLREFQTRYPQADVRLEYAHPTRVYEAVEQDQADVGLISYPKAARSLQIVAWDQEPIVLVCAPSHPWASRTGLDLAELHDALAVGFSKELAIRRELDRTLQAHGATLRVIRAFDNIEHIKRAVEIDDGIALLPAPSVLREVEAGTLVAVPLTPPGLVRPLGIIHRRSRELNAAARRLIDFLRTSGPSAGTNGNGAPAMSRPEDGVTAAKAGGRERRGP